ncbi:MAG: hypothetical protein R2838_09570 [Caldilineaceae bacterium]
MTLPALRSQVMRPRDALHGLPLLHEQMMYATPGWKRSPPTPSAPTTARRASRSCWPVALAQWTDAGATWAAHVQVIPPFALWWVGMVYDYALWRGDRAFVRGLMPAVRAARRFPATSTPRTCCRRSPAGTSPIGRAAGPPRAAGRLQRVQRRIHWHLIYTLGLASSRGMDGRSPLVRSAGKVSAPGWSTPPRTTLWTTPAAFKR